MIQLSSLTQLYKVNQMRSTLIDRCLTARQHRLICANCGGGKPAPAVGTRGLLYIVIIPYCTKGTIICSSASEHMVPGNYSNHHYHHQIA